MHRHQLTPLLTLTLALGALPARPSQAQWAPNGVALCTAAGDQSATQIVSDGAGGAIVAWQDFRTGNAVYAQRVNAAGVPQWAADGVELCATGESPAMCSDGVGGAIVAWQDFRNSKIDVYAQRVNAAGVPQWTVEGVALCTAAHDRGFIAITSDGAGGAIVAWADRRANSVKYDIYARRVSAAGTPQWTDDGVALCTAADHQVYPSIVSDGAGGAIVAWHDKRSGTNNDIYAQRVNATGVPQWTADGVALCTGANDQDLPKSVSDAAGGAIVTWFDYRGGTSPDIYAQRVSPTGAPQWTSDGVALCTAANEQSYPTIVAGDAGSAIVTWQDARDGTFDTYAQRVSASGAPQWTAGGVALCTAANDQSFPTIASDGSGGAIVTWIDNRNGTNLHVYAQRVSAAGAPQWTPDGMAVCTDANSSVDFPMIASDGAGGAIVTWPDFRNGTDYNVYAQRVHGSGDVAAVPPQGATADFQLFAPCPNPARDGELAIRFNLASPLPVSAEVLDLEGQRVRILAADREYSSGTQVLNWDGMNDAGVELPEGVYFVEVRVGHHSEARRAILLR